MLVRHPCATGAHSICKTALHESPDAPSASLRIRRASKERHVAQQCHALAARACDEGRSHDSHAHLGNRQRDGAADDNRRQRAGQRQGPRVKRSACGFRDRQRSPMRPSATLGGLDLTPRMPRLRHDFFRRRPRGSAAIRAIQDLTSPAPNMSTRIPAKRSQDCANCSDVL